MNERAERYVESLAPDLDHFLAGFFPRRKWQSRVRYDHRAHRFFLDVILRDAELARDDRFLSLLAFYGRDQRTALRERAGLELQCRLFSVEGADLTPRLRTAEESHLHAGGGSDITRRIVWLGFRQRFARQFVPRSLLWAATIVLLVVVLGLSPGTAVLACLFAVLAQMVLVLVLPARR